MEWKEYHKIYKKKETWKFEEQIRKEGIHFSMKDFDDFRSKIEKDIKKKLKESLLNFVEDYELH